MSYSPTLLDPAPDAQNAVALAALRRELANLQATAGRIGDGSIDGGTKLVAGSITTGSIAAGSITTSLLAAGAVVASKIAAGTITATQIAAGSITGDRLVANTITATQIAAGTITATQIASATIIAGNIASGTITATQIAAGTITSSLMAANSVTSAAIVSGAVTSTKISVSQLSAIAADLGTITAGTVTGATLRTASSGKRVVIDSTGITAYGGTGTTVVLNFDTTTGNLTLLGTVTASASSIVPASTIDASAGGIVSSQIQNGTIVGADIAANTIAANNIIAATITATELATDSVTSVKILANTIVAGDIASGTITATQIAAGTIDATRMNVTQLSAIAADLGSVTAGTVTGATLRTASSGARVEMTATNSAMKIFNSSGTEVLRLDGTGGLNILSGNSGDPGAIQSLNITETIGGNIVGRMFAFGRTSPAASSTLHIATHALVSGADATTGISAYRSSQTIGSGTYDAALFVDSVATAAGGRIRALTTNAALNATLTTTLMDVNGDMTVARNITATGSITTNTGRINGTTTALDCYVSSSAILQIRTTGLTINGSDRNDSLVVSSNQAGILLKSNGSGGAQWDMYSALSGGGGAGALNFYKESAGAMAGYVDTAGFHNISDARLKTRFEPLDDDDTIDRLRRLPVQSWEYKADPGHRHIGPTAQDFAAVFGIGNGTGISTVDSAGVALAAIVALIDRGDRIERSVSAYGDLLRAFAGDVADAIGGKKGKDLAARFTELERLYTGLAAIG